MMIVLKLFYPSNNKALFLFLPFLLIYFPMFSARLDHSNSAHVAPNMGNTQGSWRTTDYFCASGWAVAFQVYSDCEFYGLIVIKLFCYDWKGSYTTSIDFKLEISTLFTGSWSSARSCSTMGFITGYKIYGCCCDHLNDLSINDIMFYCSSGENLQPGTNCGDGDKYGWSSSVYCLAGTAVCGFQAKFEIYDTSMYADNTALNDLTLLCCKICNPKSSVYQNNLNCDFCDKNCKTCSSTSSTCDSCAGSDTLISNACVSLANIYTISEEFFNSATYGSEYASGGWSGGYGSFICSTWTMLGIYQNTGLIYATKTVSNLLPHYKARMKTRFYKIDTWVAGESLTVKIDTTTLSIESLNSWGSEDAFYYGNLCNNGGNENTIYIDEEFLHTSSTMSVDFSSNLATSGKSWGFSHVGLYLYLCDSICAACSGASSTQCSACYAHATLSTSMSCSCDNSYYAVSTTPCLTAPCTVCNLCSTGCNSCTTGSSTSCTSCQTDYYFYINQCLIACPSAPSFFGNKLTLTCVINCELDEYYDLNRVCQKCDPTCFTCSGSATTCTSCTGTRYLEGSTCTSLCSLGLYGVASSHQCLNDCEDQYFQHDVDRICYLICAVGYFGDVHTKKCIANCPDGRYGDPSTVRCEYCDFNCGTCSGSKFNCITCKHLWLEGVSCANPSYTKSYDSQVLNTIPMTNSDITTAGFAILNAYTTDYASNSCSPYYVVGGPGTFGLSSSISKSYLALTEHFRARVTFYFLKIDDWNNNQVVVKADTISIPTSLSFSSTTDSSLMKLCGTSTFTEALRSVDIVFDHTNIDLDLIISTDLTTSASVASWGIYELSVTIDICNAQYCKTCQGPTASDCLSCRVGLYLQVNPGPSTCESLCPDGFYRDLITNTCPPCNSLCKKCLGPSSNECLACNTAKYLFLGVGTSTCINECPYDHYSDASGVCQMCDTTCKTCNGGTTKSCLSCSLPRYFMDNQCWSKCPGIYYGVNSTISCLEECPERTFPYNISKICCPCNGCKNCVWFGTNHCTSCESNQFLEKNSCVISCSAHHYVNAGNFSCDECTSNCDTCDSLTTCSSCSNNYYKVTPKNETCSLCQGVGEAQDTTNHLCVKCLENCLVCLSLTTCQKCLDGYFLSSPKLCVPRQSLYVELTSSFNPQVINLIFSKSWLVFFEEIKDYITLEIANISPTFYSYSTSLSKVAPIVIITFNFTTAIKDGNQMTLNITYNDSFLDEFLLLNKTLTLGLKPFCPLPTTYLISALACYNIEYIIPTLKTTTTSNKLQLTFSENYGDLFNLYYSTTNISISTLNSTSFKFVISRSSQDVFFITMNYSSSISNNPTLTLNLNPPDSVLFNTSNNLQLTTIKLEISLPDYYLMDASVKALLSTAKEGTSSMNEAAGGAFAANSLMMGSSFGIKSLVSMDTIRFLRYFLIDYPPSVLSMYETSMPTSDMIPNINFDEDKADGRLPDIFIKYDISIYAFNNNGNILIEALTYLLVGCVVLLLIKFAQTTKNHYFRVLLLVCRLVFVWNYALSYYLSQFMNFNLSTFLAYRYPTKNTQVGYFNHIFSVFTGMIILSGFFFCLYMINKLRPLLISEYIQFEQEKEVALKEKKIFASNDEIFPKSISSSVRPLKGVDNNTVFPEEAPIFPAKDKFGSNNEFNEFEKEIEKNEKSLVEEPTFEKIMDRKNDITSVTNKQNDMKLIKSKNFKKFELENLSENIKNTQRGIPKVKPILVNAPSEIDNNIFSISPLSKTKDIFLPINTFHSFKENPNEVESSSPCFSPSIFQKFNKTENNLVADEKKENTESNVPWLNRMKLQIKTLLSKKEPKEQKLVDLQSLEQSLGLLNKSFFPLHKDFKHSSKNQSYYLLFDLMRQSLFSLLVVLMFDTPFSGLVLVNLVNIGFIVCFIIIRPFKYHGDFIQNIINELCLLISSMSALILAAMEKFNVVDMETKMNLGWIMVGVNTFLILMFLVRITINFIVIFALVGKLTFKALLRKLRRVKKVDPLNQNKNEENSEEKKKSDDQAILQQIMEIGNFLR